MIHKKIIRWCSGFFLIIAAPLWAGDLSSDVRKGANNSHVGDSNYIELGFSMLAVTSPFYGMPEDSKEGVANYLASIDVNLHWQYKRFFMESFSQSLEAFTFGYHFANGDQWSLDLVALEQHPELSKKVSNDLIGLKKRRADYMLGVRATGYYDDYIVQLHTLSDVSGVHDGQVYSVKVARHWQYKNWNFHAIGGASYRSERVADYYLSVQPEDATEKFPEFSAHAGFTRVFELGVTYPLSQKWVFRGLIRRIEVDRQWTASPLIVSSHGAALATSISYVF